MKEVILVGGKGTRLRPITYLNPKPMLPLVNRPFMHNFINWMKSHGLKDIIFSTGYLPATFKGYFGDGSKLGVNIDYVIEDKPLGTCGAVKNVERHLDKKPFMVFNGDILTSLNLTEMISYHKQKGADITISLTPVEDPSAYGLVPTDKEGKVIEFLEKPSEEEITTNLINAGTYIIEPHVMDLVPKGVNYSFERGLFPKALNEGFKIYGYRSEAYWLDVGTPVKYLTAHNDILDKKVDFEFPYSQFKPNIYMGDKVKSSGSNFVSGPVVVGNGTILEEGARIMPMAVIGDHCYISSGAEIEGSVIFDNCHIGKGSQIRNSILSKNVRIGENVKIGGVSVIGDNSSIGNNNVLKNGIKICINSKITSGQITF
ncbi:MAG: NDP-sugar synthase [Candidatus Humimicrobiaceae bacterium]